MGSRTRHRRQFLSDNQYCAFCGDNTPATTIEHCPPRSLFEGRQWPEGFEFPCCGNCNSDSRYDDLLIAMLARFDPLRDNAASNAKNLQLIEHVNKRYPGMLARMLPSAVEARRANRQLGIKPGPGQTHQEVSPVNVPKELHDAVCVLAGKLAKGIYYQQGQGVFPKGGCLLMNWFSNADYLRDGSYKILEMINSLPGVVPKVVRSGRHLHDQFQYKLSMSDKADIFVIQAVFGNSFGFVVVGSAIPGILDEKVIQLRETHGQYGPFSVIQSPTLPLTVIGPDLQPR